jgi:hypothetical protein
MVLELNMSIPIPNNFCTIAQTIAAIFNPKFTPINQPTTLKDANDAEKVAKEYLSGSEHHSCWSYAKPCKLLFRHSGVMLTCSPGRLEIWVKKPTDPDPEPLSVLHGFTITCTALEMNIALCDSSIGQYGYSSEYLINLIKSSSPINQADATPESPRFNDSLPIWGDIIWRAIASHPHLADLLRAFEPSSFTTVRLALNESGKHALLY